MGLWARFKRVFFASTGAALDRIENPELVLQQTIRDMRDRVPELNNAVAQVMATERLLLKQKENLATQKVEIDSKIRAAVKMQRDDIATAPEVFYEEPYARYTEALVPPPGDVIDEWEFYWEIAQRLGTTEQVIKNYLRSVYDKTGVSDRLELALFTIHHKILAAAAAEAVSGMQQAPTAAGGLQAATTTLQMRSA